MLVSIDDQDPMPIYLQIVRQIKEQILVGELRTGDELPSVRELGDALGISLHTARSAYQTLSEDGLLRVRLGKKARIADAPALSEAPSMAFREDGEQAMASRVHDMVVDACLLGLDGDSIHTLVDRELDALAARGKDATLRARETGEGGTR